MRGVAILLLSFLLTSCGKKEPTLQEKLTGTWVVQSDKFEVTLSPDGSFLCQWEGPKPITYEGKWQLSNDVMILSGRTSNSVPQIGVEQCKIIRVDERELVWEIIGQTITLIRN